MNNEERKNAIRTRLTLAKYPRRSEAVFDDANGHNPLVLEPCPSCRGSGHVCEGSMDGRAYFMSECAMCEGSGVSGAVARYFPDDVAALPAIAVEVDELGWTTCPRCERRFATCSKSAWTGRRHLTCGQKLELVRR
jgi:hypothetical protein